MTEGIRREASRPPSFRSSWRNPRRWFPLAVFVLGVLASVTLVQWLQERGRQLIQVEFEAEATRDVRTLEVRLERIFEAVHGMDGYYQGAGVVSWEEFRAFAQPFLDRHPGLEALVWVPRVRDEHRAAFERLTAPAGGPLEIREEGSEGQVVRAGQRPVYFPLHFILPLEEHEWKLGFDLASRDEIVEALERAEVEDRLVATRPLSLVAGRDVPSRIWVFRAVEESPLLADDIDDLEGFVGGAFLTEDMLQGIVPVVGPREMVMEIRDLEAPEGRNLIYSSDEPTLEDSMGVTGRAFAQPAPRNEASEGTGLDGRTPVHRDVVEVAGRQWEVQARPTDRYLEDRGSRTPLLVLVGGIGGSLLLGLYLNAILARTEDIERQVAKRTWALRREIEQRRQLANEVTTAEQRERRELARTLHDNMQQLLVAAKMKVEGVLARLDDEKGRDRLSDVTDHIDQAIQEARTLSHELSPPMLQREGLEPTLRWLAERVEDQHGLRVEVQTEPVPDPSGEVGSFVFRSVRELLLNVVKHADTDRAWITVSPAATGASVEITVEDDGAGYSAAEAERQGEGFGLMSIRQRLHDLGGEFQVRPRPGGGTAVTLRVPATEKGMDRELEEPAGR